MDLTDTPDVVDADEEPPDFDDWRPPEDVVSSGPTRERLLDVVLALRDPTKVSEVADRASCGTETARDYLEWFETMGIVRRVGERPARYERNDAYLRWRRVERVRRTHTEAEIVDALASTVDAIERYRDEFDADAPEDVSLLDADRDVEAVWEAVARWQTLERRAEVLDAARRGESARGTRRDVADV